MFGSKKQDPDVEYFAIFDTKVGNYRIPMSAINREQMIRDTENLFRNPQQSTNSLVINAEDYQLFKIGEYDFKTGTMVGTQHEHICNLHDLKAGVMQKMRAEALREQAASAQSETRGH